MKLQRLVALRRDDVRVKGCNRRRDAESSSHVLRRWRHTVAEGNYLARRRKTTQSCVRPVWMTLVPSTNFRVLSRKLILAVPPSVILKFLCFVVYDTACGLRLSVSVFFTFKYLSLVRLADYCACFLLLYLLL